MSPIYGPGYWYEMSARPVQSQYVHRPLTQKQKSILIAASTLYLPVSILRGAGIGLAAFWKGTRLTGILGLGSPDSPGGGGPGHSPTSTDTPLSLVEQGRAMAEAGKYGRTPSPSVGKESRASRGPRKKCPPGFVSVWSHRKKRYVCMAKPGTTYRTKVRNSRKR